MSQMLGSVEPNSSGPKVDGLQLLERLRDGRFHSGEELGTALGVSRSAVWKKIKKINSQFGVIVHSVPGKGYRLAQEMAALVPQKRFLGEFLSWDITLFKTLDSTNAEALRRLRLGAAVPFAVVAEQQTAGRGRRGRVWVSPFGENLYFSLAIQIDQGARQLEGLSLTVGLAVVGALRKIGIQDIGLKWPNDALASGRKIAGILLELDGDLADICHVVIGIGININMLLPAETIDQQWTSACIESGKLVDRNLMLMELQSELDQYLEAHSSIGFSGLCAEWMRNDVWRGRMVVLSSGEQKVAGVVTGVDETGALMLMVDGVEQRFSGGELSLRLRNDS